LGIVAFCHKSKRAANVLLYINVIKIFLFFKPFPLFLYSEQNKGVTDGSLQE